MKAITLINLMTALAFSLNAQSTYIDFANAGDACMSNEDYKGAAENYEKALELDTERTDYTTAMQLGLCYEQLGEMQKAGDAYKDSFMRGNFDTGIINNMRNCYDKAGCSDCLKSSYKEIATAFPEQEYAMAKRLYNIYIKESDNAGMLECCEIMLKDPDITEENRLKYLKNAVGSALKLDSTDLVESYYERILEINPNDADIHKAMGYDLYNQINKIDRSAKAAYEAKQKQGKGTQHDYSTMLTATKRATLKYGPKALEHLRIANETLKDPEISKVISQLANNVKVYGSR